MNRFTQPQTGPLAERPKGLKLFFQEISSPITPFSPGSGNTPSVLSPMQPAGMPRALQIRLATAEGSTRLSLGVNFILLVLKLSGGFIGHSRALVADGINSLLDLITNSIVWLGVRIARKPADADHQYGHGNADTLAAVFVALVLLITGGYIGSQAIAAIVQRNFQTPSWLATSVAIFTIVVKTGLFRYTLRIGRQESSPAVIANAYDHRSDVIASSGVLFGIVVAQLGAPILDPIGGLWVGIWILRQSVKIMKENLHTLMSGAPDQTLMEEVKKTLGSIAEVRKVKAARMRTLGGHHIADVDIQVDGHISVLAGHDIAEKVRALLLARHKQMLDAMVHIEPYLG